MINGNAGSVDPPGWVRPQRKDNPAAARDERTTPPTGTGGASPGDTVDLSGDDIHSQDALRNTAARLLASGDIEASADGAVRPERVNSARRNVGDGTYGRRDVISGIVDRLLEQWQI